MDLGFSQNALDERRRRHDPALRNAMGFAPQAPSMQPDSSLTAQLDAAQGNKLAKAKILIAAAQHQPKELAALPKRVDLSGLDLRQVGPSAKQLPWGQVNLAGAKMNNVDFSNTDMRGLFAPQAQAAHANFQGANLSGANISGAGFDGSNMEGAILSGANAEGASFAGVNLANAKAEGANANFASANFGGATLTGATLDGNVDGANFSGSAARGLDLRNSGATIETTGASLPEAKIGKDTALVGVLQDADGIKVGTPGLEMGQKRADPRHNNWAGMLGPEPSRWPAPAPH